MLLLVETHLNYGAVGMCDLLLQIEAARGADQVVQTQSLVLSPNVDTQIVDGEEAIGQRRWLRVEGTFDCTYAAHVRVDRPDIQLEHLTTTPLGALPSDVTKFLMPSRYCHPEDFLDVVSSQFGALSGGPMIAAMAQWIQTQFTYDNGASHGATTATDSFRAGAGVCRDYAHVLIAMARAVGIPARIVSAYGPDVTPQDFHAVAEVFLDRRWHLVDPTGMARASEIVRIGVGRDAADVSFMTSYGFMELKKQTVEVSRLPGSDAPSD